MTISKTKLKKAVKMIVARGLNDGLRGHDCDPFGVTRNLLCPENVLYVAAWSIGTEWRTKNGMSPGAPGAWLSVRL